MEEDVEWVQAVEKGEVKEAKDAAAWAASWRPDPPATVSARNAATRNHTNVACLASNANARSVEPS
jgi:hypothetical protein